MAHIMMLEDGETYTNLTGCKIVWVEDSVYEQDGRLDDSLEDMLKDLSKWEDRGVLEVVTEFK